MSTFVGLLSKSYDQVTLPCKIASKYDQQFSSYKLFRIQKYKYLSRSKVKGQGQI